MTREELIEAIEIPCIARDGSISADWLAMTLADEARIEHDRLVNPEYLAVKIAEASDKILARAVRAEKERDEARAEAGDNRPAIAAYLRAAAEDGELCEAVWEACYNTWAEFGASDKDGGRAAILALAEHVEAGR